jgi:hypothetical protein
VRINVKKPSTIYVKFPTGNLPKYFRVNDADGKLYFERFLNGKTPRIKFNIPFPVDTVYDIVTPCTIVKMVDIEIPTLNIDLPPFERNRVKDVQIIDNPQLNDTPARIFTYDGVIELGRKFYTFPKPMRVFFLWHEVAHLYYKTEEFCDLVAMVKFLEMGYNMSTAMYCLTNVLRRNKQNLKRIVYIYDNLIKNNAA